MIDSHAVSEYLQQLQVTLCDTLELADPSGATFIRDAWQRDQGGGGLTCVLQGELFEKAGVNFSHVMGTELPAAATAHRPELAGLVYQAMGVSSVIHPRNPYIPTAHLNVRFFIANADSDKPIWWFGGGYDLTPYYGFIEDCQHWHRCAKQACTVLGPDRYQTYKNWADRYFYLPHRAEPRGIGGIFFDDINEQPFAQCFEFLQAVGNSFIDAYQPIVERRRTHHYGEREREFQAHRRGRYVEFNLLHDRGTLFGLQSGGRTESILMSLPPEVKWSYSYQPADSLGKDSAEAALFRDFLPPRQWV